MKAQKRFEFELTNRNIYLKLVIPIIKDSNKTRLQILTN